MDEELTTVVTRVHSGEEAAFDELYHLTVRQLYKTMYTYLLTREDVEDAVQDAYLKLYQVRRKLDSTRSVPVYLRTIAINCAKRKLRRTHPVGAPVEEDDVSDTELLKGAVREALQQISAADRLVMGLFYGDQASIQDICRMTGEKEGTVKSRLSRARERLREVIDHGT
ncbi:MAG: sigma-70 family RNA polymerase sigma factor [Caldiserica bacterium]|jgi:RNA polymerase sigma-70 factor (ECF subfamily)|nr:sigma-70 family RNA polymerase sigma factor [Caldisericota bacterium]